MFLRIKKKLCSYIGVRDNDISCCSCKPVNDVADVGVALQLHAQHQDLPGVQTCQGKQFISSYLK